MGNHCAISDHPTGNQTASTKRGEVAERKRRREDAADEQQHEDVLLNDVLNDNDVLDDDALADEIDEIDEIEPAPRASRGRGGTVTKARPKAEGRPVKRDTERLGIVGRLLRFIREVVAELRKVIWPTRKELLTYTAVVIVFVTVMLTIVALLDLGFAKAVLWVFGSGNGQE
jgi:preprotein translocase subunit SecE